MLQKKLQIKKFYKLYPYLTQTCMYEKDVELADGILKIMNEYDWPKYISA